MVHCFSGGVRYLLLPYTDVLHLAQHLQLHVPLKEEDVPAAGILHCDATRGND